jgi:plastocyanin
MRFPRNPRRAALAAAALLLVGAGLAGGIGYVAQHGSQPVSMGPALASPPHESQNVGAAVVEPTANVRSWKFDPSAIRIRVGDSVTWTNTGGVAHTVTATDGSSLAARDGSFDSGNLAPGETFAWTAAAPGTYPYLCFYHPLMMGTVVVTE